MSGTRTAPDDRVLQAAFRWDARQRLQARAVACRGRTEGATWALKPRSEAHMTLGSATEAIRRVLAWPPDASYEAQYANARKGLNELQERLSESERKRYDAEREVERLRDILGRHPNG